MKIKQVVVTGQHQVELQEAELDGAALGSHEILVRTESTFISAGTELANYTGREPKVFQPGNWCTYPWRSGYANVGIVEAVGSKVTRTQVGERVFTYGNHASAIRYSEERLVAPVPDGLELSVAAASRMAAVSMTAIIVSEIVADPWVAIFGLGMVGNIAAQLFQARGCRVIGVDPVAARRNLAEECGLQYSVGGDPAHVNEAIKDITHGRLANITVDAVGHSGVIMEALAATATHGQLVLLGTPRVPLQGDLTALLSEVHLRWVTLRGALEWCIPMYPVVGGGVSQYSKQQTIFDWIKRGKLKLDPLISHQLKPEQIKEAYEGLLNQSDIYAGVALDWS